MRACIGQACLGCDVYPKHEKRSLGYEIAPPPSSLAPLPVETTSDEIASLRSQLAAVEAERDRLRVERDVLIERLRDARVDRGLPAYLDVCRERDRLKDALAASMLEAEAVRAARLEVKADLAKANASIVDRTVAANWWRARARAWKRAAKEHFNSWEVYAERDGLGETVEEIREALGLHKGTPLHVIVLAAIAAANGRRRLAAAESRLSKAKAALERYAVHDPDCDRVASAKDALRSMGLPMRPCTCGLDAALAESEEGL